MAQRLSAKRGKVSLQRSLTKISENFEELDLVTNRAQYFVA
jgi:hypothetical protein